jgi:preprotein translocase subunit SecG
MQTVLLVIHLFIALALIGFVLMQRSEGGALGIGGGGAGSLFSARGVGNALTRVTAILAVVFFITSIALTLIAKHGGSGSLFDQPGTQPTEQQQPLQNGNSTNGNNALPKLPGSQDGQPAEPKVPVSQ